MYRANGDDFAIQYLSADHVPSSVKDAFAVAGLGSVVNYGTAPVSLTDIFAAHDRVREALGSLTADTYIDAARGVIKVTTAKAVADVVKKNVEARADGVPVNWTVGSLGEPSTAGGYAMTTCTAGFVVKNPNSGNVGVATAGHCPSDQSYLSFGSLNFKAQALNGHSDFQWHDKGSINRTNAVYDGSGTRSITERKNWSTINDRDQVVKYDKTTGDTTGTVIEKYFCPNWVPNCSATLVVAGNNASGSMSDGGDSGGPWMVGGRAWGFDSGHIDAAGVMAPQSWMEADLGVHVMIQ